MRFKKYLNEEILTELAMDQAIEFAEQMHKGQVRKGDQKPYVVHPKAVYSILKSFGIKDKVLLVAAWLHDTIEDTITTYNIIKKKFNKDVADLVKSVSSSEKEIALMGKEEYLLKKMLTMSNNGLTLKLADRLHNVTDIMQMSNGEKTYIQTTYILSGLKEKRNLNKIQKKIIRAIERYLDKYKPVTNEVYMSKSLSKDLDASRTKKNNKFAISVDGFAEEEAKTIKRANTLRQEWIRFTMRNRKISRSEAEKIVKIERI